MKKKKLLKKLHKMEETLSALQTPSSDNESFAVYVKTQDCMVRKLIAMEENLNQLINEHQQILTLIKQMNKSYTTVLENARESQSKINAIYQLVDSPEFRNAVGLESNNTFAAVYTDASYNHTTSACGYGFVVESSNGTVCEYNGIVEKPESVGCVDTLLGEAYGVIKALELMDEQRYRDVVVYTDNKTVVNWADGQYVNSCDCSKWFVERLNDLKLYMNITVVWMKRCTCDYNRKADKLARMAMFEDGFIKSEQSMTYEPFKALDFSQLQFKEA